MNDQPCLFAQARNSLLLLGGSLLLSLAAVGFTTHAVGTLRNDRQQQQIQITRLQHSVQSRQQDLAFLQQHDATRQQLKTQGLLIMPERMQWIAQLLAAHKQLELPATLTYSLPPPQLDGTTDATDATAASAALVAVPMVYDLEFSLTNIHEEDLLNLIARFRHSIDEPFRVQSCQLSQPLENGLSARCSLRFYSLLPAGKRQP
jgi:hypothetical protein